MKFFLSLICVLFLVGCDDTETLLIETNHDDVVSIHVEIADTKAKQQQGLMHREELCERCGMLFDFGEEKAVSMWMKNTLISLDMFFIDEEGMIVDIAESTQPLSLKNIRPCKPARYVLETNAGFAMKYKIEIGNQVKR